jgi:DNA-binding SARP family transcriptional activator
MYPRLLLLFTIIFFCHQAVGQSYGLGFAGNEAVQDKRSRLDLSPGKTLCFSNNFELSFELSFLPDQHNYFGYICRIIENDHDNIDLLFDNLGNPVGHFRLVKGEQYSHILFDVAFSHWNKIKMQFDLAKQTLTMHVNEQVFTEKIALQPNGCFKLLFGANDYKDFKTTDVPPMKVRDIVISEDGAAAYHWPLNEADGLTAPEILHHHDAAVVNPLWMKKLHSSWQSVQTFSVNGAASVAFDPQTEKLYVMGSDSLLTYTVRGRQVSTAAYNTGYKYLVWGNESLFDTVQHVILNTAVDDHTLAPLNLVNYAWDTSEVQRVPETNYALFNKYYSPKDSSVYLFGGYGHFQYKQVVQRYHLPTHSWEQIPTSGDTFAPRYLSALGGVAGGAYIIGGYGSTTGQQLLHPRNLYDMVYFDAAKHTFKKLYELQGGNEDFVFANSLVIDEAAQQYYGLIFSKQKYNAGLQLIRGSLRKPGFEVLADRLPFLFQDIRSFADLYYCPVSKRLLAVTLLYNGKDRTEVNVFSLYAPPIAVTPAVFRPTEQWWMTAILAVLALGGIVFLVRRKRVITVKAEPIESKVLPEIVEESIQVSDAAPSEETSHVIQPESPRSAIFLFGDLQLFDESGQDITRNFTPLLKELFLLLLLHTLRLERGISPEKLNELLWFDKSADSARNNRAVNIAKLKSILERVKGCTVTKETGYWRLQVDPALVSVDLQQYLQLIKKTNITDKKHILALAAIIRRGAFLANTEYEWLDKFKSEIANEIIDACLHYASSVNIATEAEFLVQLTDYVFYFDPANEEAMIIQCRSFVQLGKHSLAKSTFDSFCREYNTLYGESFAKDFSTVLS